MQTGNPLSPITTTLNAPTRYSSSWVDQLFLKLPITEKTLDIAVLGDFQLPASYFVASALSYFFVIANAAAGTPNALRTIVHLFSASSPQTAISGWAPSPFALGGNGFYAQMLLTDSTGDLSTTFAVQALTKSSQARNVFAWLVEPHMQVQVQNYAYSAVCVFLVNTCFFSFLACFFCFTLLYSQPVQLMAREVFMYGIDSSYGLVEAEKEVGPMDDILLPILLVLFASIMWFFLLMPLNVLQYSEVFLDGLIIFFFCYIIVSLPINLLYECGFFFSTFFRGAAGSTSTLMELVYDLIANTTMFARMQVQHVRVILGLAMYMETANYVETLSLHGLFDANTHTSIAKWSPAWERSTNTGVSFIVDQILQISTLIAEIGHYIVFLIQSSASYAALIFWLFSLLYSGFVKEPLELYFAFKAATLQQQGKPQQ